MERRAADADKRYIFGFGRGKKVNTKKYVIMNLDENARAFCIRLYSPAHQARVFSSNIVANWWAGLFKVMR